MIRNMKSIYALYSDPDAAERAVNSLRAATKEIGIEPGDIRVISAEPFEHHEFSRRESKTAMPWVAALGGLIGGLAGYTLTSLTQRSYPLATGGMPLAPMWTNGIIIYELIMLGAILATVLNLLFVARLPSFRRGMYDPAISEGKILVGVMVPHDNARALAESCLSGAGPAEIKLPGS